jgi:hypothetical protein
MSSRSGRTCSGNRFEGVASYRSHESYKSYSLHAQPSSHQGGGRTHKTRAALATDEQELVPERFYRPNSVWKIEGDAGLVPPLLTANRETSLRA